MECRVKTALWTLGLVTLQLRIVARSGFAIDPVATMRGETGRRRRRLAIIAPSANSLVRFKAGRYAFAEAQRREEIETYLPRERDNDAA